MRKCGNRKRNNAGFTLVEVIVVMVLITILLGVASVGIIAFQDQARRMKLDDTAENIFTAAQARLTRMSMSGDLKHWQKLLKNESGEYLPELKVPVFDPANESSFQANSTYITKSLMPSETEDGRMMNTLGMLQTTADIWNGGDGVNSQYNKERIGELISLKAEAGDYDRYLHEPGTLSNDTLFLFALLTENIFDPEILNSAICLELAPEDAQVFSAFYSTDAESFAYLGKTEGAGGQVDISRREYTSREDKDLGYFGVETLTHVSVKPPEDLKLGKLVFKNDNTLHAHLSFNGEVEEAAPSNLDYTLTVYDFLTKKKVLVFRFSGKKIEDQNPDIVKNYVACETFRYDHNGDETPMGELPLPIYWEKKSDESVPGLSLILDAADASAATSLLDGPNKEAEQIRDGGDQKGDFVQTLSFFRFGTWTDMEYGAWTERVYLEISAVDNGDGMSGLVEEEASTESEDAWNPYFATMNCAGQTAQDKKNREFVKTAEISNGRHLYNIRYFEDLAWETLGIKDPSGKYNHNRMKFRLTDDIDWAKFARSSYYATTYRTVHVEKDGNSRAKDFGFPSIRQLRSHDLGSSYSYDELIGEKTGSDEAGVTDNLALCFAVSGLTIRKLDNLTVSDYLEYKDTQQKPTGFFLENCGKIDHFAIDKSYIEGEYKVGAICGVNRGTLTYSGTRSTRDEDHPDPTIVKGIQDVGGVFGYNANTGDKNHNLYYKNLTNNARVLGQKYVGGITGRLVNGAEVRLDDKGTAGDYAKINQISFTDCENYGQVRGEKPEDKESADICFVGGIVGYIGNTALPGNSECAINRCYSHPVYDANYDDEYAAINKLLTIRHADLTVNADTLAQLEKLNVGWYVGGIAGYAYDITFKKCGSPLRSNNKYEDGYGNELTQNAFLFGDRYVGGIAGLCSSHFLKNSTFTNYMTVCGNEYVGGVAGMTAAAGVETDDAGDIALTVLMETANKETVNVDFAENRGCVFAKYDYAGGLVGLSYGGMKQNRVTAYGDSVVKVSGRNFVGGITGRHRGDGNTEGSVPTISCSVDGENYVGGMIAYAGPGDKRPYDKNIEIKCSVYGNGSFTGGVYGAIADPEMAGQVGVRYTAKPVSVDGHFYVGGAVGAVMLHDDGTDRLLMIPVKGGVAKDDTQLELHARAFAGGEAGYTVLVNADGEDILSLLDRVGGVSYDALCAPELTVQEGVDRHRAQVASIGESLSGSIYVTSSDGNYICRVKSISPLDEKGLVYAGGVVGINGESSKLNFRQLNYADTYWKTNYKVESIRATSIIEKTYMVYDPKTLMFGYPEIPCAYAGPLIGLNNENSTIEDSLMVDCTMSTEAFYRGGMCEINEGTILWYNKMSSQMRHGYLSDDEAVDCVGTMCGKNDGSITLNHSPRFIVKGRNVVGGLVGENYGTIKLKTLEPGTTEDQALYKQALVEASGEVAGGVVGRNMGSILCLDPKLMLAVGVQVTAKDAAGGYIGEQFVDCNNADNSVELKNFCVADWSGKKGDCAIIEATDGCAGAIIGRLVDLDQPILIENCSYEPHYKSGAIAFNASVKGKYAGGLIGEISMQGQFDTKPLKIKGCTVLGQQIANGDGAVAGGIIGRIDIKTTLTGPAAGTVEILDCISMSKLQGSNGRTAGIVYEAVGKAVIDNCRCYTPEAAYGICKDAAYSITNCLANDREGDFGSCVEMEDGTNFRNNYCIKEHIKSRPSNVSEDAVGDVTDAGLFMLREYNDPNTAFEYYGSFTKDGKEQLILTELRIPYNSTKPALITSVSTYKSHYKTVDAAFEDYLKKHKYTNTYIK